MRRKQPGQHLLVRAPAFVGVVNGLVQICGELGVPVTDVLQRRTDRLPRSELGERAPVHLGLPSRPWPDERVAERPIHMPDDGQSTRLTAEQGLRERADEWVGRQRPAIVCVAAEFVVARGSGTEAGEQEGDHPRQVGVGDIRRRKPVRGADLPAARPRPVLAYQRSLDGALVRVAGRETHPVGRGEEQVGSLGAGQQGPQPVLGGVCADEGPDRPGPVAQRGRERRDQVLAAQGRRRVVVVASGEEGQPSGSGARILGFGRDDVRGVSGIAGDVVEVDPSDRVLYVQLVLDLERDLVRATDEQQVIRNDVRVDRSRSGVVTAEEILLGLAE